MARIAYSYQRFSNQTQARGDSLRRQQELVDHYIAEKGLILDKTLTDRGVSAFKGKNARQGALKTFLDGIESGDIPSDAILICESLDRLSRNSIDDALDLFLRITRKGVTIVTLSGGVAKEYDKSATAMQLIECLLIFQRANEESAIKSERVKSKYDEKVRIVKEWSEGGYGEVVPGQPPKIITGEAPAWIDIEWQNKKDRKGELRLNKEKATTVKQIIKMYFDGFGFITLAKELNQNKVKTISKADLWHHSYLNKILDNPALYGALEVFRNDISFSEMKQRYVRKRVKTGIVIENYFPALISKEDFDYLQSIRKNRGGRKGRKGEKFSNLFTGLAVCGECGSTMRYVSKGAKGKNGDGNALVCSSAVTGSGCSYKQIHYHNLEGRFFDTFKDISVEDLSGRKSEITIQINKKHKECEAIRAELKETEEKIDNIINAIAEGIDSKKLKGKLSELESKQSELSNTIRDKEAALAQRERESNNNKEKFKEILDKANAEGSTYYSRSQINEALKRYIHFIAFYPFHNFAIIKSKAGKDISFDYADAGEIVQSKKAWLKHTDNNFEFWSHTLPDPEDY